MTTKTRSSPLTVTMKTSGYNVMRDDSALLEEHERSPASFVVNLYPDHWTLNSGPKFSYNNPISSILDNIRGFRIPTDFIQIFDEVGIPYYNGCLIVELLDFRPARSREPILERPDKQRVVLRPNGETVWADICIMNAKTGSRMSDMDALQVEAKLLLSTSTPLCLEPDLSLMRITNSILRVSTPNVPNSLKRKSAAMDDHEEDETEKAKRAKIMQFMNPQFHSARKPFMPSYRILSALEQHRTATNQQNPRPASSIVAPTNIPSGTLAPPSILFQHSPDKTQSTVVPQLTTAYSQSNALQQPVPVAMPQTQLSQPTQTSQQAPDPSQRLSPSKQQQAPNGTEPQRPPSQPVGPSETNTTNQQPQAQGQQPTQPAGFNPPLPPTDFLNQPPSTRRRPSIAIKPGTPSVSNVALPNQQPISQQQQQSQPQPQTQTPGQPQQASTHPVHVPPNMSSLQAMTQMRNMAQFYQNAGGVHMPQTASTIAAQRQALSGRNTPINRANASASPAPSSAMARSPMLPAAAAVMSRQNTPVSTNGQATRGSPLVGSNPVAARAVAVQNGPQQQLQQPMTGAQPVLVPNGAAGNSALAYQHYQHQLQNQRIQAYFQAQQRAQQQAQMHQQGHMTPAPQQQPGSAQPQQSTQEQTPGTQQPFAGVQIPPQAFNYMQMNPAQQHYLWQQRAIGRGMPQAPPNGQQQVPVMPPGMTMQQMQGLGRGGGLPNR